MSSSVSMVMTASATAGAAVTSAASNAHAMHGMGSDCKISMLWNWYTIDACFLSSSWQIKNRGMFAASCIGVVFLVISLEIFRRMSKEYDNLLLRRFQQTIASQTAQIQSLNGSDVPFVGPQIATFRASPLQQLVRAVLHAVTFGIAYIVMLLAMYYNGYFIISIFIGAGLGKFVCDWMVVQVHVGGAESDKKGDSVCDDPTMCCG